MDIRNILCFALLIALTPTVGAAFDPATLYSAETVVANEGSETRNAALRRLLAEVLVRVSGNTGVAGQPAARVLLDSAPSLVEQYRYRNVGDPNQAQRVLWARFDQPAVERMMRARGMPVWVQRPRVLLWLAGERAGQRSMFNPESEAEAMAAATGRARQRGLPLQLPLMDLEDQASLSPADLWSGYQEAIRAASQRYPHEAILTGRLRAQGGDRWTGNWTLIDPAGSRTFQTPRQPLAETLAFAIDQAQNLLAARYAPMPGSTGEAGTLVSFSAVHSLADYGRLLNLVEQLDPVTQVALRHLYHDNFVFEFRLRGARQELERALDSVGRLAAEPDPAMRPPRPAPHDEGVVSATDLLFSGVNPDLHYRLLN